MMIWARRTIAPIRMLIGRRRHSGPIDRTFGACWLDAMTIALSASQPRVEQDGANVGEKIGPDIDRGRDQHRRFDQRHVTQLKRIDEQRSEPRIREYLLDNDDAADEIAEI